MLQQLIEETGATAVFYNHLYDPISLVRDNEAKAEMAAKNVSCFTFNSELLYEPWEITDDKGNPFTKFSEFWERCDE